MDYKTNFIINHTTFNTDHTLLFCSTNQGIRIYNINPFRQLFCKTIKGGISFGSIYQRSNIFYLVGTGIHPDYPTNRLIVWDEYQKKKIAEVSIKNKIEGFILDDQFLQIYSKKNIFIYDLYTLNKNYDLSLVSYTFSSYLYKKNYTLCYPLINYQDIGKIVIKKNGSHIHIHSHNDPIHQIAISPDGKYIATCSNKGYLVKLFSSTGSLVREYNRGFISKQVSYLGFSSHSNWLICATEYSTLHLFDVNNESINIPFWRERSRHTYNIDEIIVNCHLDEEKKVIIFNSVNKIYTGNLSGCQPDTKLTINHKYLLIIDKDPFSLSPKYLKK